MFHQSLRLESQKSSPNYHHQRVWIFVNCLSLSQLSSQYQILLQFFWDFVGDPNQKFKDERKAPWMSKNAECEYLYPQAAVQKHMARPKSDGKKQKRYSCQTDNVNLVVEPPIWTNMTQIWHNQTINQFPNFLVNTKNLSKLPPSIFFSVP